LPIFRWGAAARNPATKAVPRTAAEHAGDAMCFKDGKGARMDYCVSLVAWHQRSDMGAQPVAQWNNHSPAGLGRDEADFAPSRIDIAPAKGCQVAQPLTGVEGLESAACLAIKDRAQIAHNLIF